jgi:glycerophosphoryl diester phosphodiesterase
MSGPRVRVVGHRGAPAHAPENTLASLERAARDGADEVELDVQRTADRVTVLLHDDTIDRTTSGHGRLRELPWAEVRKLDAGSWFGPEFAGERVPSLAEVCAWARSTRVGLSVELKQPAPGDGIACDEGLADDVVGELDRSGLLARSVIHSADHPSIARVRSVAPGVRTALSYSGVNLVDPLAIARTVPGIAMVNIGWLWISADLCRAMRAAGIEVHAWGVPEPFDEEIVARLIGYGVSSLSADDPGALVHLLASALLG